MSMTYRNIYGLESYGGFASLGLKIEAAFSFGREPTENERRLIVEAGRTLREALLMEIARTNPENQDRRQAWIRDLLGCFPCPADNVKSWVVVPNEYCSFSCCWHRPWLKVETPKGPIKIGPRKRVIVVDWTDSVITKTADELFAEEDTTKSCRLIHAWGLEKAFQYISRLMATVL